ncbi:MAG: hypothetical protein QGH90_04720 [Candidatus Poseidoniaceae archaeon]|nr:hypothetical protein [Candidatus Poseidoniaceae archaeon]
MRAAAYKSIFLVAIMIVLSQSPILGNSSGEFSVEPHHYSAGDWYEYDGYGLSLANSLANSYSVENASEFVGWSKNYDEPLLLEVVERGTCDFGEWAGSCMRSTATHSLNITLEWVTNSTPYDDDKMVLNITTTIQHEEPIATTAWNRERRTIAIAAWFLGDGESNIAETESTTIQTTHSSSERPKEMMVGDTWQSTLEVTKEDTLRQRLNRGMWNDTSSSISQTREIIFTVEEESTVHTAKHDWQTLRLREQAVGEDNYSLAYLSEYGWPVRTEEYEGGVVVMTTVLTDFSSAQYDGPKVTTIEESPAPSALVTGIICLCAAILVARRSPANYA